MIHVYHGKYTLVMSPQWIALNSSEWAEYSSYMKRFPSDAREQLLYIERCRLAYLNPSSTKKAEHFEFIVSYSFPQNLAKTIFTGFFYILFSQKFSLTYWMVEGSNARFNYICWIKTRFFFTIGSTFEKHF